MDNQRQDFAKHIHVGKSGESCAIQFLKRQGYRILETNYRTPWGEIDVIAKERDILCFIEVKTRQSAAKGSPLEAVSTLKQRKLARMALGYLQKNKLNHQRMRFDVVGVCQNFPANEQVTLVRNAFRADNTYF